MWAMVVVLVGLVALAVLGPLFGADSRDGLDWTRNAFWMRRRTEMRVADCGEPAPAQPARARRHRAAPVAR